MPFIQINQLAGMDEQTKAHVIERVTEVYAEAAGKDPAAVWVHLVDMEPSSFGKGGKVVG